MVRRLGISEVPSVATETVCRKSRELRRCAPAMAGLAFDHGVRAYQRKAVLMVLNRLNRDGPTLLSVTLLATPAKLATVDIRVASRARGPDVAENLTDVALRAGDTLMHPTERKAGPVVIEFRNAADRLPTRKCVAVIARYGQRAVRAA
jgi:hypothetical protein